MSSKKKAITMNHERRETTLTLACDVPSYLKVDVRIFSAAASETVKDRVIKRPVFFPSTLCALYFSPLSQ